MNSGELISIVIPCYNSLAFIGETLRSAYAQEGVEFEVIVVDDGSTDAGADFVEAEFPEVRLFRTANGGPSAARNFGTAQCRGEFIQYLDADDLLAPGKLATQVKALRERDADVAYGDWTRFRVQTDGTKVLQEQMVRQMGRRADVELFVGFWCPPAAYLLRRRIVDRVGGWKLQLPVIQDARFMLDCALQGARFHYCSGVMAEYRTHEGGSVSTRSRAAFLRDCLVNAREVREWWESRDELDAERRRAVLGVFDMVATASAGVDEALFEEACGAVDEFDETGGAEWAPKKRAAVGLLGYREALRAAHYLRQYRKRFTGGAGA